MNVDLQAIVARGVFGVDGPLVAVRFVEGEACGDGLLGPGAEMPGEGAVGTLDVREVPAFEGDRGGGCGHGGGGLLVVEWN